MYDNEKENRPRDNHKPKRTKKIEKNNQKKTKETHLVQHSSAGRSGHVDAPRRLLFPPQQLTTVNLLLRNCEGRVTRRLELTRE